MNMRNNTSIKAVLAVVACLVGCSESPTVPDEPTWEADVYPILQGQCLHCHGSNAKALVRSRFDFFDFERCDDMEVPTELQNAKVNEAVIRVNLKPQGDEEQFVAFMPPLPAQPLEQWETQTLIKWLDRVKGEDSGARGTRRRNKKPTVSLVSKVPSSVGNSVKLRYLVEDADGDPVIGWIRLGEGKFFIDAAGGGEANIEDIGGSGGDELTITAELCDGWDKVELDDLGTTERK